MRFSKREMCMAFILCVCIIFYTYYTFLYKPLCLTIEKIADDNKQLKAVSVLSSKLINKNKEELNNEMAVFEKLNKKIPESEHIPETIEFIENSCETSNLQLLRIDYEFKDYEEENTKKNKEGYKQCLFEIDVNGKYKNHMALIRRIESAPRLYNIEEIRMFAFEFKDLPNDLNQDYKRYSSEEMIMTVIFKSYYDEIVWDN